MTPASAPCFVSSLASRYSALVTSKQVICPQVCHKRQAGVKTQLSIKCPGSLRRSRFVIKRIKIVASGGPRVLTLHSSCGTLHVRREFASVGGESEAFSTCYIHSLK